jgi:hypothetical protein
MATSIAFFDRLSIVCIIMSGSSVGRVHSVLRFRAHSIQNVNQVAVQTVMQFTFPLNVSGDNLKTLQAFALT